MSRALVLCAAGLVACIKPDETSSCGEGPQCADGKDCVDGECRLECIAHQNCPTKAEACRDGYCRSGAGECSHDGQCTRAGACEMVVGAACWGGACVYALRPAGTECVDSDPCTRNHRCTAAGQCVGERTCSAPVANGSAMLTTDEDTAVLVVLTATDDEDPESALTITITSPPARGTLAPLSGTAPLSVTYTPGANYHGADAFGFTATDTGGVESSPRQVSVSVAAVNDLPVASAASYTLNADDTVSGTLSASDVDGDPLTFALVGTPAGGTVTVRAASGEFLYAADHAFDCQERFAFSVSDGQAESAPATVLVARGPPQVARVSPARGTTGLPLVLEGKNLCRSAGSVTVGGRAAEVASWGNTVVAVVVPGDYDSGVHDVVATTVRGESSPTACYEIVPWINRLEPAAVAVADPVVILGDSLGMTAGSVYVGGARAFTSRWQNTRVEIMIPGSAGVGRQPVRLETSTGESGNVLPVTIRGGHDVWITDPLSDGRHLHTAVWTGTEMVVWGGRDTSGGYLNTGSRYNPATDTWVATSTTGAPAGRYGHTAVWTGTGGEMIVWGGDFSGVGRYQP